jgi:hypothetical protein
MDVPCRVRPLAVYRLRCESVGEVRPWLGGACRRSAGRDTRPSQGEAPAQEPGAKLVHDVDPAHQVVGLVLGPSAPCRVGTGREARPGRPTGSPIRPDRTWGRGRISSSDWHGRLLSGRGKRRGFRVSPLGIGSARAASQLLAGCVVRFEGSEGQRSLSVQAYLRIDEGAKGLLDGFLERATGEDPGVH